jgi:hypothetical protein
MTIPSLRRHLVVFLIVLVYPLSSLVYGGDAKDEAPLIEAKWIPFFDKGYTGVNFYGTIGFISYG